MVNHPKLVYLLWVDGNFCLLLTHLADHMLESLVTNSLVIDQNPTFLGLCLCLKLNLNSEAIEEESPSASYHMIYIIHTTRIHIEYLSTSRMDKLERFCGCETITKQA